MNIHRIIFSTFLLAIPFSSMASWQVSKPDSNIPSDPFFQGGRQFKGAYTPAAYKPEHKSVTFSETSSSEQLYAISISGSLKENLERIMGRYHWRVVWKAPYDYNFDGRITGNSLPNVVEKLLQPFPLQAVMYMSNRTIAISPKYRT